MGHSSCSRIAGLLELAIKWSASKDSVGGAIACMPKMIFCGLWTTAGRVIIYGKSECKVNTNVFIFIYYYPPQSTAGSTSLQQYSKTAAEARRVSVNYVIAGVNSKDSVQMSCNLGRCMSSLFSFS